MPSRHRPEPFVVTTFLAACALLAPAAGAEKVHFSYLWHQEQPIYWPDRQAFGEDRYERANESLNRGGFHPENNLAEIFGKDDRVAAYQWRMKDSIGAFSSGRPEAGAQISFSGGLIENLQSLGGAYQLGYTPTWYNGTREARGWLTYNGFQTPRAEVVIFPFHHPLMPLVDESTQRKEIQLYKEIYSDAWGTHNGRSTGLFPPEMAFSTRMIPVLEDEGIDWVFVSSEKISRACEDFPVVLGSGGINCDPPNKADQINPPQTNYYRLSIDRGVSPAEATPFAYTPHYAQYVDPETGDISRVIVVPCSQHLGWRDGYSAQGTAELNDLQNFNDPNRPQLVIFAHDGDNAWGGGFSYYLEATPNRVNQAVAEGFVPTVVPRYLHDHPVPTDSVVHVEDGAWVNADGDFGAPQFLNWNWPLLNAQGDIDVENGWHVDARNWAVITAAQNRVDTAEQLHTADGGSINLRNIIYPNSSTNNAERAWHYFLGALNSGYMYYGSAIDMELKPTIACNEAVRLADAVINDPLRSSSETTGPTVWIPQREPWNPGSLNFGPSHGYQQYVNNGDFYIWTFAYDASGIPSGNVTLKYRIDNDGTNPLASTQNETFAGGAEVGPWQTVSMTKRAFPAGNIFNYGDIDFSFEMPQYIADQYYSELEGLRSVLIDYYIEATDALGNVKRSPIQHVYIGDGTGATGPGDARVTLDPELPAAGSSVQVSYDPAGSPLAGAQQVYLHYGFNGWQNVPADPPMTFNAAEGLWQVTVNLPSSTTVLDVVFNDGQGTWDNNNGQDWHFQVSAGTPDPTGSCCVNGACSITTEIACTGSWTQDGTCSPNTCPGPAFSLDGSLDGSATLVASNDGLQVYAAYTDGVLYVAATPAGNNRDHFLYVAVPPATPGNLRNANWAKSGQIADWSAFLADEHDNGFFAWFASNESVPTVGYDAAQGTVMEGTASINQISPVQTPEQIALALGAYDTNDGGALQAQAPASVNADNTIDAGEYLVIDLCSITPQGCPNPCVPDINGDGQTAVGDILDFLSLWAAGTDPRADINNDGNFAVGDVLDFLSLWAAGC